MDFKKILNIFNPQLKIGALEITDVDLKYVLIAEGSPVLYSVKLAAGIVKDGKIKDREGFLSALSILHSQIVGKKKRKKIGVIANISDNNVYFQVFNLPVLERNIEEAVNLNLRMISPIDFNNTYSDWQKIGEETIEGGGQTEIFGVFAESKMIDEFDECLKLSGFIPAAFEFSGLALTRLAMDSGTNVDKKTPFILFFIGNNGLSFNLIRNGNLYFNHFVSWQAAYSDEREIPLDVFKRLISDEIKKVLSFYGSRWKEQVNDMILVTHGLSDDIVKIISENFSFKIQTLALKKFSDVLPGWFSVLGSAFRGLIPRSKDKIVSLAKVGTEEEFFWHQLINFARIWRNVILAFVAVVLILFAVADLFLIRFSYKLDYQLANLGGYASSDKAEFNNLKKEIERINGKINLAVNAYSERSKWSAFLEKIKNFGGESVSIKRIYIQSLDMPALVNASALSEEAALDFKNKLISDGDFENVDLPITKIIPAVGGVNFTISFKIKK